MKKLLTLIVLPLSSLSWAYGLTCGGPTLDSVKGEKDMVFRGVAQEEPRLIRERKETQSLADGRVHFEDTYTLHHAKVRVIDVLRGGLRNGELIEISLERDTSFDRMPSSRKDEKMLYIVSKDSGGDMYTYPDAPCRYGLYSRSQDARNILRGKWHIMVGRDAIFVNDIIVFVCLLVLILGGIWGYRKFRKR